MEVWFLSPPPYSRGSLTHSCPQLPPPQMEVSTSLKKEDNGCMSALISHCSSCLSPSSFGASANAALPFETHAWTWRSQLHRDLRNKALPLPWSTAMDVLPNVCHAPGLKAQLQQGYDEKVQTFMIKRPSIPAMSRRMAQVPYRTASCLVVIYPVRLQSC